MIGRTLANDPVASPRITATEKEGSGLALPTNPLQNPTWQGLWRLSTPNALLAWPETLASLPPARETTIPTHVA